MKVLIKNIKNLTKIGPRGLVVFLGREAKVLGWNTKTKLSAVVFQKGKKKGLVLEKI